MSARSLKNFLDKNEKLILRDGIYYQKDLPTQSAFENQYIALRKDEGRVYTDEVVAQLPKMPNDHLRKKEWVIRKRSADRLVNWMKSKKVQTVLEVGCGNGWLLNYIQSATAAECCGLDVNETELQQASRVFGKNSNLHFAYLDIHLLAKINSLADCIVLASSFQYFSDPQKLVSGLLNMLKPSGGIHIVDTNFYDTANVEPARQRSENYFTESGYPGIQSHYHHHSWDVLKPFRYTILYNPASLNSRIIRKLRNDSPFPWIVIESQLTNRNS